MVILVKIVKNRSISNECKIAGTHNAFRFFSFKTFTNYRRTQKTPFRRFPMAAILSKKSQVIMTTWSHGMLVPEGSKPKNFFIPKKYREISSHHFGPFPDK
jgi:hypothetical protein